MNRRIFIKGLAGLAALLVAPTVPARLVETEKARFLRMMKTGLIESQTFYLDAPIEIDYVNNLVIRNCVFKLKNGGCLHLGEHCQRCVIERCTFWSEPGTYRQQNGSMILVK
jgi:hypothetical protein